MQAWLTRKLFRHGEALGEILVHPFQVFTSMQASGGIVLFLVTVAALIWANSSWASAYEWLRHAHLDIRAEGLVFDKSVHFLINEGLMTIFFFVVGLEIKREVLVGELASFRKSALPIAAAIGGMAIPALIYYSLNRGTPEARGWGIPMATDIAFTVGAITLLGARLPDPLKILLSAIAIVDDIGAVLVIAIWYTDQLSLWHLQYAGMLLLVLIGLNILGFRRPLLYLLVGGFCWFMVYESGVHSTVAGILVALTIPARPRYETNLFADKAQKALDQFISIPSRCSTLLADEERESVVRSLQRLCRGVQTPLQRIEHSLHPWVAFLIVPLFALVNAGVAIDWSKLGGTLMTPSSLGISLGLFLGKQIGIFIASWLVVRTGLAIMPPGVTFVHLYGIAILCGVGFTMSLFIADLAFSDPHLLDSAKLSILSASLVSFIVGIVSLLVGTRKPAEVS